MGRWDITGNMIMIAQLFEVVNSDGYHIVTAITDKGNTATESYYYDSDRDRAYERAQQRALEKD